VSPGRDTSTRFPGIYARHQYGCAADPCVCKQRYYGIVWDHVAGKQRRTRRCRSATAARNARAELIAALEDGKTPTVVAGERLDDAIEGFVAATRDGVALNKWGGRYRARAVQDLESSLNRLPD
jgi:hypothetical protein